MGGPPGNNAPGGFPNAPGGQAAGKNAPGGFVSSRGSPASPPFVNPFERAPGGGTNPFSKLADSLKSEGSKMSFPPPMDPSSFSPPFALDSLSADQKKAALASVLALAVLGVGLSQLDSLEGASFFGDRQERAGSGAGSRPPSGEWWVTRSALRCAQRVVCYSTSRGRALRLLKAWRRRSSLQR